VREEFLGDVEQFLHAGAAARGDETDRHQMAFAQTLFEGVVQFLAAEAFFAHFEEVVHHPSLISTTWSMIFWCPRRRGRGRLAGGIEEAIDHRFAAVRGQVERQALVAEGLAQFVRSAPRSAPSWSILLTTSTRQSLRAWAYSIMRRVPVADAGVGIDDDRARFPPPPARRAWGRGSQGNPGCRSD
jgi:hypothetical protein